MSGMLRAMVRGLGRLGPVYVMVQVTARCNLRCRICRVWTLEHKAPEELSTEQLGRMARILASCGVSVVTVAGEPFLRPDLPEIVGGLSRHGLSVRLQTNGTLIDSKVMDDLVQAGLRGISISLHSLDPAYMDWISNETGVLDRVREGLSVVFRATRHRRGFMRIINTVISRKNLGELESLADFAASRGFRLSVIPLHASTMRKTEQQFSGAVPSGLEIGPGEMELLRTTIGRLKRHRRRGSGLLNSSRYLSLIPSFLEGHAQGWPCLAGTLYFFVDHRGQVSPCHELDPVGSIFDPRVAESIRAGDVGFTSKEVRKSCPGCLLPCWSELSLTFSHPVSFLEAMEVNLRGAPAGNWSAKGEER